MFTPPKPDPSQTLVQLPLFLSILQPGHAVIVRARQCQLHKLSTTDCTLLVGGQHTHTQFHRLITVNTVYAKGAQSFGILYSSDLQGFV